MKSLSALSLLCLFACSVSAQLFYTDPSKLHKEYVEGFNSLYSGDASSALGTTRGASTSTSTSSDLSSEKFQWLASLGDKLLIKAEKHMWKEHAEMALYLHNVGCLYAAYKQHDNAERLFRPALEIWMERIGHDEPQYISTALHLAECYILEGKSYKSNLYLKEAYNALNAFLIPDRLHEIEKELEAAGYYWNRGDNLAAEYYLLVALKKMPKTTETDGNHAYILASLGRLYQEMRRFPESVGFLKMACEIWSKQNAAFHPAYVYYEENMVKVPTTIDIERYTTANTGTVDMPMGEIEDSYHLRVENREVSPWVSRGMYINITPQNKRLNERNPSGPPAVPYREIPLKTNKPDFERDLPKRLYSPRVRRN